MLSPRLTQVLSLMFVHCAQAIPLRNRTGDNIMTASVGPRDRDLLVRGGYVRASFQAHVSQIFGAPYWRYDLLPRGAAALAEADPAPRPAVCATLGVAS